MNRSRDFDENRRQSLGCFAKMRSEVPIPA